MNEKKGMGPVSIPIDGILDLHAFSPKDVSSVVQEYLRACRKKGIFEVRIIHGKGIGNLRRSVHAILGRIGYVKNYRLAGPDSGTWGATLVDLAPPT